jgi:quinol monooxygenase YgiN
MTLGIVAKLVIKADQVEHFETHFLKLAAVVLAEEPGCRFYALHRSRTEDNTYVVLEQYDDEAAFAAHGRYDAFKAANVPLKDCLAAAPSIEVFDGV